MKLMHLSDLHLGKRVNDFSMLPDQRFILDRILQILDEQRPDALLIAGDVYDKSVPSAEAVELLDDFLVQLARRGVETFVLSGNHDSPERLAFGGRLMTGSGIHMSGVYDGKVIPVSLRDGFGEVRIYMLPFVKPAHVRRFFPESAIESYTDAIRTAVEAMDVDLSVRNVLLTHQFVTGAARCESEEISVGGTDNVDASVLMDFDYVALGHIHGPQNIIPDRIRYCGTPLKYSFSECTHKKSVTMIELEEKGSVSVYTVPLVPLRDMRELRGSYMTLTARENYAGTAVEDYLHIILTDEEDIPEAAGRLRVIYPNLMKLSYDNTRTRGIAAVDAPELIRRRSPLELFEELYAAQNNQPMSDVQREFTRSMMESIWEDGL